MNKQDVQTILQQWNKDEDFSGVISVYQNEEPFFEQAYGFANRTEEIPNRIHTRFGVASGTKMLTGLAICKLVEQGVLSFDTRLKECVDSEFPHYDPAITIHHLLTHSSGITSYFEEDINPDYEALWREVPMYRVRSPRDFLPLFQQKPMKFPPGERWDYNDGGFILLGLVIEAVSGKPYQEYVKEHILLPADMQDSGYFYTDQLPSRTAYGYIKNPDGSWRTNFFAVPIVGGSDGGIYTTAADINKLWKAIFRNQLLNPEMTKMFLAPEIRTGHQAHEIFYGYGIYVIKKEGKIRGYYICGGDPGVDFLAMVYPDRQISFTALGNTAKNTWPLQGAFDNLITHT
jgi:CubicO group peptidase (beta-lactamase class C family)